MAKKKVHRPRKANATKPRRRPLGRGSGPVEDHSGGHWHDDGSWHDTSHDAADAGHAADGSPGRADDAAAAAERELRLALVAEVEAVPAADADAALLANPLVAALGARLVADADTDRETDPDAGTGPAGLEDDDRDDAARLARWTRTAVLADSPGEREALAAQWRTGGEDRAAAAVGLLGGFLGAAVAGDPGARDPDHDWLGVFGAVQAGQEPPGGREAAMAGLQEYARAEVLVDLLGRLALTGAVEVADTALAEVELAEVAGSLVERDVRLFAAAGLFVVEDGVAVVDRDLRPALLTVADALVEHLEQED